MLVLRDKAIFEDTYNCIVGVAFEEDLTAEEKADMLRRHHSSDPTVAISVVFADNTCYDVALTGDQDMLHHYFTPLLGDGTLCSDGGKITYFRNVVGPGVPVADPPLLGSMYVPSSGAVVDMKEGHYALQTVVNGRVVDTSLCAADTRPFVHSAVHVHGVTYGMQKVVGRSIVMFVDDRGDAVDDELFSSCAYVYWSDVAQKLVVRDSQQVWTYRALHARFAWLAACVALASQ
jgi:hypothetical protein